MGGLNGQNSDVCGVRSGPFFYRMGGGCGMKKVLSVVALLAAAIMAAPATAGPVSVNDLPGGSYAANFENYSDLYVPAGATWASSSFGTQVGAAGTGTPMLYGASIADLSAGIGVLENRAIFNAATINTAGNPIWSSLASDQQLTGLFYDLTLTGVTQIGPELYLDFSASTRTNPLAGSPGLTGAPANSGGVLQVYESSLATPFSANVGGTLSLGSKSASTVNTTAPVSTGAWAPAQWVEGSGTSSDTYPTASQGSLWLEGEFEPLVDASITPKDGNVTTVFEEAINLTSGVGSGVGNVYVTGGSEYPRVTSLLSLTVDERLPSNSSNDISTDVLGPTTNYYGTGYWPADSNDPAGFTLSAVPEPVSMIFFVTGLVAVGGFAAKRRMLRNA